MRKITVCHETADFESITTVFEGDEYSVATFGDKDIIFTVLSNADTENERPHLMVPCRSLVYVKFDYEE